MKNNEALSHYDIETVIWLRDVREHLTIASREMVDRTPLGDMFEVFGACSSVEEVNQMCRIDFYDEMGIIADFLTLSKDEFLERYSHLTYKECKTMVKKIIEILTNNC